MKPQERAILNPFIIDWTPKAGDREIRMRPLPLIGQTKPCHGQKEDTEIV